MRIGVPLGCLRGASSRRMFAESDRGFKPWRAPSLGTRRRGLEAVSECMRKPLSGNRLYRCLLAGHAPDVEE